MSTRVHIVVAGRVQGVGFRFECRRLAIQFGLQGWVKNRDDGSVEIVAEGDPEGVKQMTDWARKGPFGAVVNACRTIPEPPTGECESFDVRF
ncbi:MAG: acylphosphatase [Verrucomicrobia bacterium]|nr:acylphosphatase [Verrucomicrobiota bacterium]MCG2680519.1 acylphosphatase [Kiritimatiellia bacterium]MBU4248242.1 acylphosphatase [Verrucomicrobiota bacterium]MBU4290445.1 acylphosphatase [Verrucomicrobiota bacterium]MBU4428591.1 acylphosphatase [Verrucomicrobiota bacterium]